MIAETIDAVRDAALSQPNVKPMAFVHFVLKTNRFAEMGEFYKIILNAKEVFRSDDALFLTYDEEHHRVAIFNAHGTLDELNPRASGLEHLAYAYKTMGDLLANYLRLKALDIHPYWCINHGPTTSLYFRDPDGNQIETQTDNFDTLEELVGYFHTDEYRENFLGLQFDPDQLVDMYRRGVPEVQLKWRGAAPRAPGTEYVFPM